MSEFWGKIYPAEFEQYKNNPKAIPMEIGEPIPGKCKNCGGSEMMMIYLITGSPQNNPVGKCKWIDFDDDPKGSKSEMKSGWYPGEMIIAPCPVCRGNAKQEWLRKNSGLKGDDFQLSLDNFLTNPEFGNKREAWEAAKKLLEMKTNPHGMLTYYGGYGVGKTHLLKAIVNGFIKQGVMARYYRLADLIAEIRENFGDYNGTPAVEDAIEQLSSVQVLCLDEIDKVNLSGWTKETIFRIIDDRYNKIETHLTVLATNLSPDSLMVSIPEFGYIKSRISGGQVIEIGGSDMRIAKSINQEAF